MKRIFLVLAILKCTLVMGATSLPFLAEDSSLNRALKKKWDIKVHTVEEVMCLDEETLARLGPLRLLNLLNVLSTQHISLAQYPLNQWKALKGVDVLKLYRAGVVTMDEYLAMSDEQVMELLEAAFGGAQEPIRFERRVMRFHKATQIKPKPPQPEIRQLPPIETVTFGNLNRALATGWGVTVRSAQEAILLKPEELSGLHLIGEGSRLENLRNGIQQFLQDHGEPELLKLRSLTGRERLMLDRAGVTTREQFYDLPLAELLQLLAVTPARAEMIANEHHIDARSACAEFAFESASFR